MFALECCQLAVREKREYIFKKRVYNHPILLLPQNEHFRSNKENLDTPQEAEPCSTAAQWRMKPKQFAGLKLPVGLIECVHFCWQCQLSPRQPPAYLNRDKKIRQSNSCRLFKSFYVVCDNQRNAALCVQKLLFQYYLWGESHFWAPVHHMTFK